MSTLTVVAALGLAVSPSVIPVPVGAADGYRPPSQTAAVAAGTPVDGFRCTRGGTRYPVHLELFANGRAVVVPAGIGVARPFASKLGAVVPAGCSYPLRTLSPTGVVGILQGSRVHLADLFRVWGQPLARTRLASFSSRRPVRAYVAGRRYTGDLRSLPLTPNAEIVLEVGPFVPPHPFFLFPEGPV